MRILQVLLSICATFWGIIFALEGFGVDVTMDLTLYQYLLLVLGMVTLVAFPYTILPKKKDIISKGNYEIDKPLIHRMFEEEIAQHEHLTVVKTEAENRKEDLFLTVTINVEKVEQLNAAKKTQELTEAFKERMVGLFGEETIYNFHIVYKANSY